MENNLYLVHNISSSNFIETINRFNGLICPSLAIIKDDNFFNKFGSLTLLIDPSFIFDEKIKIPKSNRKNFVYDGDSYSSTFPEIYNVINAKERDNFFHENKQYFELCDDYFSDFHISIESGKNTYDIFNYLNKLNGLKYKYLIENSLIDPDKFKIPYKKQKNTKTPLSMSRKLKKYLSNKDLKSIEDINIDILKTIIKEDNSVFDNFFKLTNNEFLNKRILDKKNNLKKDIEKFLSSDSNDLLSTDLGLCLFSYFHDINKPVVKEIDRKKLSENFDHIILSSQKELDYKNKIQNIVKEITNSQYFLFNENKYQFNEDNILKYFRRSGTKHSEKTFTYSINKAKSNNLSRIYSFSDIIYESKKIDSHSSQNNSLDRFNSFKNNLLDLTKPNIDVFDFNDTLSKVVVNIHKEKNPDDFIIQNLSDYFDFDNIDFPKDELISINKSINSEKVNYFEVKNLEKLNTSKILKVLVPKKTDKYIIDFLKDNNIPYSIYSDETSYLRILNRNKKHSLNNFKSQKTYLSKIKN